MVAILWLLNLVIGLYAIGYLFIYGFFAEPPIPNRWWSFLYAPSSPASSAP